MVRVESGLDVIEANPVRVISNSNVGPIKLIRVTKSEGRSDNHQVSPAKL
jgi:hypothetical protein